MKCSDCKFDKPKEGFNRSKNIPRGYDYVCKECRRKIYQKNKVTRQAYGRAHYHRSDKSKIRAQQMRWHAISRGSPELTAELIYIEDIYERDKGICQICSNPCNLEDAFLDHIKGCNKGGEHVKQNVQLSHLPCNHLKYLNERWLAPPKGAEQ